MWDVEHEVWVVGDSGRLSADEAAMVRMVQARGEAVMFASRHQWRHFQRHP